jgi:hypothetical protein
LPESLPDSPAFSASAMSLRHMSAEYDSAEPNRNSAPNDTLAARDRRAENTLSAAYSITSVNLSRSNTKASKYSDVSDQRLSTLSRMSSVASSIRSFHIQQATVHRYSRVLWHVNEMSREGTSSPPPEDLPSAANSAGACDEDDVEDAWRVAAYYDRLAGHQ